METVKKHAEAPMPDRFLRLFFALPCPPPLAERIGRWRDDRPLPGRQVATANLHLTLAFLGQVPYAQIGRAHV